MTTTQDDGGPAESVQCKRCGDVFEHADQAECCEDWDCPVIMNAAINNSLAARKEPSR